MAQPVAGRNDVETVTIANGTSLSAAINLVGRVLVAVQMPAAWTTAALTFQASADGETFAEMFDDGGTAVSVAAAASRFIALDSQTFAGARSLKVRSGTTGSPVNQAAERAITLILRDFS